MQAFQVR